MGQVIASASMSLDGYIAKQDNSIGRLFDWLQSGDIETPTASPGITFHLTKASADYWNGWLDEVGCLVVGRLLFDLTEGWKGEHPIGVPFVVLTHEVPTDWAYEHTGNGHFVTDGIEAAVARAMDIADGRSVGVAGGTMAGQAHLPFHP